MDFTNKIVFITGGSRGIGRTCAQLFAEHGATVVVHYNSNANAAQETLDSLAGSGHTMIQADVSNPVSVEDAIDRCVATLGGIDILVNNAGIYEEHPILEVNYDEWQAQWTRIINTNLIGAANMAYCAAQFMKKRGGGRIVNVSSRGAFRGEPTAPAYGASKAGMNAMGQSLALALAPHNIFVATVAPGWVETDMASEELKSPRGESIKNQSPLGRIAKPEEVAYTVLFLAAEQTAFLTGAIVDVNGASYLRT